MLNVAIFGAGRMGRIRAMAARDLGARVSAICDSVRERADALAHDIHGAVVVTDYQRLPWNRLDAVFICTPPAVRLPAALCALEANVHLFIEKPIGLSAADGDALVSALDRWPVVTAVGYMNRYRSAVQHVQDAVQGQRILGVVGNWACGRYGVPWWTDPAQSGGAINEQSTHVIDLCRYMAGEIAAVQVMTGVPGDGQRTESAVLNLRFESGALGSLFYSCEALEKMISFGVVTEQREYRLEGWDLRSGDQPGKPVHKNAIFTTETEAFLQAILQWDSADTARRSIHDVGQTVLSDLRDAVLTQRVVDMVLRAAQSDGEKNQE